MSFLAKNRVLFSIFTAVLIVAVATGAIFWARGFKPDFKKGRIDRTGLLVISSSPTGAQVYLDDRLTSVTDTNIAYLDPKTYKLRVEKDGYIPWEKEIQIKADLANEIKAVLFPLAPEIKPLTITGAFNPSLSPDGEKLVYGVGGVRGGLYVLPMNSSPLQFRQNPRNLIKNQGILDFANASFIWSPDSKQLIATFADKSGAASANLLVDAEKTEQDPRDITGALSATLNSWQDQLNSNAQTQALLAPDSVKSATAEAALNQQPKSSPSPKFSPSAKLSNNPTIQLNYSPTGLMFSPDEEKILFKSKDGKNKVYDLKLKKEYTLPDFADFINLSWFPDSNHLVVAQTNSISAIEADGTNKMVVYSGKFENGFVFAHPSASRIIILTTLTQTDGTPANLYAINLK